jgi:hypothetical protein
MGASSETVTVSCVAVMLRVSGRLMDCPTARLIPSRTRVAKLESAQ